MKNNFYILLCLFLFLLEGGLSAQQASPKIPTAVSVPDDQFNKLKEITHSIYYESSQNLECPQVDVANAKNLAEAIGQIVITLQRFKAWISEGLMRDRSDTEWLRAESSVNAAYIDIDLVQRAFYKAMSRVKILPQSYKAAPGPATNDPYKAIRLLNDTLQKQINRLGTLQKKFVMRPAPTPTLMLNGRNFRPDEKIEINFTGRQCYPENAWIGIIPSAVPHNNEKLADQKKTFRKYISNNTNGKFTVKAPINIGSYDFRMFDSNENGNEVASVSFTVTAKESNSTSNKGNTKNAGKDNSGIIVVPRNSPSRKTGYLVIETPVSGCNMRSEKAEVEIRQLGYFVASTTGPKEEDKNTYEVKPPPYRFELKPGEYDVTFKTRIGILTRKVTVQANTETTLSRGKIAGKLEIYFLDHSGNPMHANNYAIIISGGEYPEYKNFWWTPADYDSILLPTGKYAVTISYLPPKTSESQEYPMEINIKPCEIVTIYCYDGRIRNASADKGN